MARVVIGTSGWTYRSWRGPFYPTRLPSAGYLSFYSHEFLTNEINCTFYHLPTRDTFSKWARDVPEDFVFAVKANQLITHRQALRRTEGLWRMFVDHALGLGRHLGPILLQFPPTFERSLPRLQRFLDEAERVQPRPRLAFEFRHESWFVSDVYRLLAREGAALCIADGVRHPRRNVVTTDFAYVRFHGRAPREAPDYSDQELREEARMIARFARDGIEVNAYFNNDARGHAVKNAMALRRLIRGAR